MMAQYESSINTLDKDIQALQEIVSKTWKKEDELCTLKSELAALDDYSGINVPLVAVCNVPPVAQCNVPPQKWLQ